MLAISTLLLAVLFSEAWRVQCGWVEGERLLRPGYKPGDLKFDPLNQKSKLDETGWVAMQNKELNNGRLAMMGIAGMCAQEAVTGTPIFA